MGPLRSANLAKQLIYIRSSLWFVPALILAGAVGLAMALVEIDRHVGHNLQLWAPRLFGTEADGARLMLGTIAGSMATVAGVVFSITIVALALASTQYSSRVLRNFMRDRATQIVLGVFVGVYAYCLLVLRTISSGNESFIPSLAVLVGFILALVAIGFFIFFIHHISTSIQASETVAAISRDTVKAIDLLFSKDLDAFGERAKSLQNEFSSDQIWRPILSPKSGYIQAVDSDSLVRIATDCGGILRMEYGIGEFVAERRPIASLSHVGVIDEKISKAVNEAYALNAYRTIDQDPAFGFRQLVDIALKALSPSINDTTTAVTCIEYMSILLTRCASRELEPPLRRDESGVVRLIMRGTSFDGLTSLAFGQILENGACNTEILIRTLMAIGQIAEAASHPSHREALAKQTLEITELASRARISSFAKDRIAKQLQFTSSTLQIDVGNLQRKQDEASDPLRQ